MLGGHFAALGEAAAGEDVAMRRSHVALVRTVFSYAVYEGFYREEIIAAPIYNHTPASEPATAPEPRPTPVAQEPASAREEPATPASEPAADPTPGAVNSTEETDTPP